MIGTGKFDIYKEFGNRKIKPYIGVGGSIYFFFAAWGSINTQVGFRYKNFTLDTSLARWKYNPPSVDGVPPDNFGPFSHSSWNPKLGFRILNKKAAEDFWFKIGPSFIFNQNNGNSDTPFGLINIIKIKGLNLNVEGAVALKF